MFRKLSALIFIGSSLWACSPTVDVRGNLPLPESLAQIKVGETTEEQVQTLLGSPSTALYYGDETWHYVYQKIETVSFFTPKVIDSSTLTIMFDTAGRVKSITKTGMNDLKPVQAVDRETPTAGKEFSVIEQLLGNVGKFAKESKGK